MYKGHSECMAYSGLFRTVDISSQFQAYYSGITGAIYSYSELYLGRLRDI